MTKEMMVDIETLDVVPRAVVLSVAAVPFTQKDGAELDKAFMKRVELQPQFEIGRTVSEATLNWWFEQDKEVIAEAFHHQRFAADKVLKGLATVCEGYDTFWANGPQFDFIILEDLARDFGVFHELPWMFFQQRCVRTIKDEAGLDRRWQPDHMPEGMKGAHDPVTDCYVQIEALRAARDLLPLARL